MGITTIKPIETIYHGRKFRSRLEARWAVFFDAIGADWEYEPEGYQLSGGTYYLPDFLIRDASSRDPDNKMDLYVEVKGDLTFRDLNKVEQFSKFAPIIIFGSIPVIDKSNNIEYKHNEYMFSYAFVDGDGYSTLPVKGKDCGLLLSQDMDDVDLDSTISAYKKASMARFEHGENK